LNNVAAGTTEGTSTGSVTTGAFLGHSATWVLTQNPANANLKCNKAFGQEATLAHASLTIAKGRESCVIGGQFEENARETVLEK
jgi:hypothetical protein